MSDDDFDDRRRDKFRTERSEGDTRGGGGGGEGGGSNSRRSRGDDEYFKPERR